MKNTRKNFAGGMYGWHGIRFETGEIFRLQERSLCAAGSAWAVPTCCFDVCAALPLSKVPIFKVHADLDEVMKPK